MEESKSFVCSDCVGDIALQTLVRAKAESDKCDYCGNVSSVPMACDFNQVIDRIRFSIEQEYFSPDEMSIYDFETGDYVGDFLCIKEVFEEIRFYPANEELRQNIDSRFLGKKFVEIGEWDKSPSEKQFIGWERFKRTVKHHRRFTFWSMRKDEFGDDVDVYRPSELLNQIAISISEFGLISTIAVGSRFWRVRVHEASQLLNLPNELAAPTSDQAKYSNRMSPAGVPMFYGAEDYDTAFKETVDVRNCRGNSATAGVFVAKRELNILDLCQLPQMHSFFSPWTVSQRHGIYFLRSFQKDLAKPIRKDDRQHIEYVPTQVFTEFMRFEFRSHYSQPTLLRSQDIKPIDGIRYPSSKTGRPCIVLFLEQHDCLSGSPDSKWNPALELDLASVVVHKNLETKE